MKASIVDPIVLQSISPRAAIAYLRAYGWNLQESVGDQIAKYRKDFEGEDYFEIDIPLRTEYGDYWRRIKEALDTLELVESRSQLEIVSDIKQSAYDVVRVGVVGGAAGEGRIGLDAGTALYRHARDLMLSAACAAIDKRPTFATRKPDQAMDYLRRIFLGPSSAGSYILSIESPVAPSLAAESRQESLPLGHGETPEDSPYERRVTLTLANAISATVGAAATASASGGMRPFVDAVSLGVHSNLCDALSGIIEGASASSVNFRFSWAPSRRPPEKTPSRVQLEQDIVPILREASKLFREQAPQEDFEIEGVPETLESQYAAGGGRIVVFAVVDGRVRKVELQLNSEDYQNAIRAHRDGLSVYCEGELVKEGRNYTLTNPRQFSIRED